MNCKKCNKELTDEFCSSCEFPKGLKRIDKQYIIDELRSVLNFEKGVLYTIKWLLIKPDKVVKQFIHKDRSQVTKPVIFMVVCLFISSIVNLKNINKSLSSLETSEKIIFKWLYEHENYFHIFLAILFAFWIKLLFKKYGYNYYEILVLLFYLLGIDILILAFFNILENFSDFNLVKIGRYIVLIYTIWAIGQFFEKKNLLVYVKAILSGFLGILTFFVLLFLVIGLISLII